jgi:hypothetical protein
MFERLSMLILSPDNCSNHELDRYLLEKQKQEFSAKGESAAPPMTPSSTCSAISSQEAKSSVCSFLKKIAGDHLLFK